MHLNRLIKVGYMYSKDKNTQKNIGQEQARTCVKN